MLKAFRKEMKLGSGSSQVYLSSKCAVIKAHSCSEMGSNEPGIDNPSHVQTFFELEGVPILPDPLNQT
jgi:hypothetical protein